MSDLEVLGTIATVAGLVRTLYSISKDLYQISDVLSSAPSDINDLARDLETFAEEPQLLYTLLDKEKPYADHIHRLTAKIIGDCATICMKVDRILGKMRSGKVWARVRWIYKEKEIRKLLARLRDLKLSLMSTLSFMNVLKADLMIDALGLSDHSLLQRSLDQPLSKETIDPSRGNGAYISGTLIALHNTGL
ncbi:hypothetical protein G7Y89_g12629 [Cudoniella acicularis]|uniref:Fungal N-terminal domain-containing protein n=1 Tax=Cudoniella acicularis TaxID=354080 RepID=A0A8H4RB57_9HELO|nr:hypothetical protein G7Y89_g12629 [Cudoniella acicularis]